MSAILSADDLNDFISPGVACIKPVETLSAAPALPSNPYEVTTEDVVAQTQQKLEAAQISLTDCLACSGCVTSAEAVLVSLQSHSEVLSVLDGESSLAHGVHDVTNDVMDVDGPPFRKRRKLFVASVSPQTRASLAAAVGTTTEKIGNMIDRLLLEDITIGGTKRGFDHVLETEALLSVCLHLAAQEVESSLSIGMNGLSTSEATPKKPILTSECPGFICYLEKTHPEILPNLSKLKSPQAVLGTLLKSVLPKYIPEDTEIYHVAIMPCFDKKLEASRAELTDATWKDTVEEKMPERDVDCVITTRELVQLATARGVDFAKISAEPVVKPSLPVNALQHFIESNNNVASLKKNDMPLRGGTCGGYLMYIMQHLQGRHPGSTVIEKQGRNSDVTEFILLSSDGETEVLKMARYYGFKNIQNLVRKLKPTKTRMLPGAAKKVTPVRTSRTPVARGGTSAGNEYCYVEVMACPGGCTNGGGQIKADDKFIDSSIVQDIMGEVGKMDSKAWLARVDEAYFSSDEGNGSDQEMEDNVAEGKKVASPNGENAITAFLKFWTGETNVSLEKLAYTTYRAVQSDVGKPVADISTAKVAELAGKAGGGW